MLVKINRNQIHHFREAIVDAQGVPTGETKDILQLDFQYVDYPNLGTYGIKIDFPITEQVIKDAIGIHAEGVKAQVERDVAIREILSNTLEFDTDAVAKPAEL